MYFITFFGAEKFIGKIVECTSRLKDCSAEKFARKIF